MANQNSNDQYCNITNWMYQAFGDDNFYGLEYVLDEIVSENPAPAKQNTIDWFGSTDYFA